MTTLDLDRAQPQIRALARALGWERRQVVEALEAHASIQPCDPPPMFRSPKDFPAVTAAAAPATKARFAFLPARKFDYVRSDALMRAYRLIPCQHCGADDGTVCGAHSNWAVHGKGRGIKASDIFAASLCHADHAELDQGLRLTEAERQAMWWQAHIRTVSELLRRGLWPEGVPVPDITRRPF